MMEAEVRPQNAASLSTGSIYSALSSYDFSQDPDFQAGLVSLTSDPTLPPSQREETIFQAQCFYFARKYNLSPVDAEDYKSWLRAQADAAQPAPRQPAAEHPTHVAAQPLGEPEGTPVTSATTSPSQDGPPYPASFESIVDLITRNQPIPGIEEIPDTVLDASLSAPNQTARRKKPWETDDAVKDVSPVLDDAVEGSDSKPTGVVGILQPTKRLEEAEATNPGAIDESGARQKD